ncbi:unnamed protein product [Phytomonas sp. EM1]|nr:unnamed protein product [Phytomonas sp. EM1]|eukprot:CCW62961.1 unnamed protein product [Phytomonas sp. isolate EM1]
MQECTYGTSVTSSSQQGPSSTTESDDPSDHVGTVISSEKNLTHNNNSEGGKTRAPSSTLPPNKNLNVCKSQETGRNGNEMPTKLGVSNTPTTWHSTQLSTSQKVGMTRTALSKALCAIAKTTKNRNASPAQSRPLYRPRHVTDTDRSYNERGPRGSTLKEANPKEPHKEEDSTSVLGLNVTAPLSSTTSRPTDGVSGRQGVVERDDGKSHLPPVTSPYIRRQCPSRRCKSATPAISTLQASSGEKHSNNKDGSLSGRILRALGAGTANSSPAKDIPSLGSKGYTKFFSVDTSCLSSSQSKQQKDASPKLVNEGSIFSRSAITNPLPDDDSINKPKEALVTCASEVHRLYRNILINRPRSPLPFIIDQLHQQLEHKNCHDVPSPGEESKTISREVHFVEDDSMQGETPPAKQQPPQGGNSSLSHGLGVQPVESPPKEHISEALSIGKPVMFVSSSTGNGNDTILDEQVIEDCKAPDNTPLLNVPTFNSATKHAHCDNSTGDSSEPNCTNCGIMCRRQPTCSTNSENGEENFITSTKSTKPSQGHVLTLSGSTQSSSVGVRSSAPHSWIIGTPLPGSVANKASAHPNCTPPLPHSNPIQRGFSALSRVNPPHTTTTTAVLPVFSKRASLTGSMMAAGSAVDVRSSGSDISSVFSAAPVDVQEMLRELRAAKEAHVGMAQSHVTWNELVDILESVSFPTQDATLLSDLFDELWKNQQKQERMLISDTEPAVSKCNSPMTPPLWTSGGLGRKQHYVCSPFDGKPMYSTEGTGRGGFPRVQANHSVVQSSAVEAVKGLTTSEKRAALPRTLQDQPPIPAVRFETFLACMSYKIQGRYPVEVIRQAFFDLVEECGVTHTVASDTVSHKLGLVLESAPPSMALLQSAKELKNHSQKRGCGSLSRGKSNDPSLASGCHDRSEEAHPLSSASCTDVAAEPSVSLELSNIADANPDIGNDGQTKGQESLMSVKLLQEDGKESFGTNNSSAGTAVMKETSQITSNLTTHIDFMGSITSSSRLFSPHLAVMTQTVPLRVCVVEGLQGLLGLSDFDGKDVAKALIMAEQPLQNLDYHCHLDEFIRLVHCMTTVMNRKAMNSSHSSKAGNLHSTLIRSTVSVTASGNAGYSCSSNNNNSMSRSENEGNPVVFSLNVDYAAR